mgnify:CR=1 FL=1
MLALFPKTNPSWLHDVYCENSQTAGDEWLPLDPPDHTIRDKILCGSMPDLCGDQLKDLRKHQQCDHCLLPHSSWNPLAKQGAHCGACGGVFCADHLTMVGRFRNRCHGCVVALEAILREATLEKENEKTEMSKAKPHEQRVLLRAASPHSRSPPNQTYLVWRSDVEHLLPPLGRRVPGKGTSQAKPSTH